MVCRAAVRGFRLLNVDFSGIRSSCFGSSWQRAPNQLPLVSWPDRSSCTVVRSVSAGTRVEFAPRL